MKGVIYMNSKTLSVLLKVIIAGVFLCSSAIYFVVVPDIGESIAAHNPDYAWCYVPWLILIWATGLPLAAGLVLGWKIASGIGADRPFTRTNSGFLKWIAVFAAGDAALFFIGNAVMLLINASHFGVLLLSLFIGFVGAAIAVAAAVLSNLVMRAALLQEQNDLTI